MPPDGVPSQMAQCDSVFKPFNALYNSHGTAELVLM